MSSLELSAVEHGEGEAVGEDRPVFLHQVQGQSRLPGAHAVEEADVRIQPDLLGTALDVAAEQAVQKGQQRVYRVGRRALAADSEGLDSQSGAEQRRESAMGAARLE